MTEPRVAILVLNWNGWSDTLECLESISRLEYRNVVIVLCDNASNDGSMECIREWAAGEHRIPTVELTRTEAEAGEAPDGRLVLIQNGANLGFAEGNNVGLRYLLCRRDIEYVWMVNNDVVVDVQALAALVKTAEASPKTGAVGATIYEYDEPDVIQAAGGGRFSARSLVPKLTTAVRPPRSPDERSSLEFISGSCMLVRLAALETVGLIDGSFFMYCEDVDLCVRLRAAGFTLAWSPAARVWHKGGGTIGHRSERHDYYTIRNTLALVRKHHPLMTPLVALYLVYRAGLPKVVRGQWTRLAAGWRGYTDFTRGVTGPARLV